VKHARITKRSKQNFRCVQPTTFQGNKISGVTKVLPAAAFQKRIFNSDFEYEIGTTTASGCMGILIIAALIIVIAG